MIDKIPAWKRTAGLPACMILFLNRIEFEEEYEPWTKREALEACRQLKELEEAVKMKAQPIWHTCLEIMQQSAEKVDFEIWFQIMWFLRYEII